jgi:hypothetical protein
VCNVPRDASKATDALGAIIGRFERRMTRAMAGKTMQQRLGPPPTRLKPLGLPSRQQPSRNRPVRPQYWIPTRYRRPPAPSLLQRLRAKAGNNPLVAAAKRGVGRVAQAVRNGLARLKRGLGRTGARRLAR